MKARCEDPTSTSYQHYGARGVRVCKRWLDSFENFLADMGEPPSPAHTIDRLRGKGHYDPGNCRWATMQEQQNNRSNNHHLTAFGKTQTLEQWARETGFEHKTILGRLKLGWTIEKALTLKPRSGRNQYSR
jgi:hypothetical protein